MSRVLAIEQPENTLKAGRNLSYLLLIPGCHVR